MSKRQYLYCHPFFQPLYSEKSVILAAAVLFHQQQNSEVLQQKSEKQKVHTCIHVLLQFCPPYMVWQERG